MGTKLAPETTRAADQGAIKPEAVVLVIDDQQANLRIDMRMQGMDGFDRGPGISEEDQARLFQRFSRLSAEPTQGETSTGLGLPLARQQARAMGGNLWYERREGGGAIFTLELPLA